MSQVFQKFKANIHPLSNTL